MLDYISIAVPVMSWFRDIMHAQTNERDTYLFYKELSNRIRILRTRLTHCWCIVSDSRLACLSVVVVLVQLTRHKYHQAVEFSSVALSRALYVTLNGKTFVEIYSTVYSCKSAAV